MLRVEFSNSKNVRFLLFQKRIYKYIVYVCYSIITNIITPLLRQIKKINKFLYTRRNINTIVLYSTCFCYLDFLNTRVLYLIDFIGNNIKKTIYSPVNNYVYDHFGYIQQCVLVKRVCALNGNIKIE